MSTENTIVVKIPSGLKGKERKEIGEVIVELLQRFGTIRSISVLRTSAFVEFETIDEATRALGGCTIEMNARLYR